MVTRTRTRTRTSRTTSTRTRKPQSQFVVVLILVLVLVRCQNPNVRLYFTISTRDIESGGRGPTPRGPVGVEPSIVHQPVVCALGEGITQPNVEVEPCQWSSCIVRAHRHDRQAYRLRLVVTMITPLAPRTPYTPVDATSFSTSIRTISCGGTIASVEPTVPAETGTSSIISSGSA